MQSYGSWQFPGLGLLASVLIGLDFETFAKAAIQSWCPATVIGLKGQLYYPVYRSSSNLIVIEARDEQLVPG